MLPVGCPQAIDAAFFSSPIIHSVHQKGPATQALQGFLLSFDFYGIMLWELLGHRSELKVARYKL
jgi:hypothetical protein